MSSFSTWAMEFMLLSLFCLLWSGLLASLWVLLSRRFQSLRSWRSFWVAGLICTSIPLSYAVLPQSWNVNDWALNYQPSSAPLQIPDLNVLVDEVQGTVDNSWSYLSWFNLSTFNNIAVLWSCVFVIGLLYCLLRFLRSYQALFKIVTNASELDEQTQVRLNRILRLYCSQNAHELVAHSSIRFLCATSVTAPFTYSLLRPTVVLPDYCLTQFSDESLALILEHELIHVKHQDSWLIVAAKIIQMVQWFNPLVFWMGRQLDLAIEMHCDAQVLQRHPKHKQSYSRTMLNVIEKSIAHHQSIPAPGFGRNPLRAIKTRLVAIQNAAPSSVNGFRKLTLWLSTVTLLFVSFFAQPQINADQKIDLDLLLESIRGEKPVKEGRVSSRFGARHDPFENAKRWHRGIDYANASGTEIYATAEGLVVFAGELSDYGNVVDIHHGHEIVTRYSHLGSITVSEGQQIKQGQTVGIMGVSGLTTGPHVHYEVRQGDVPVCPTTACVNKNE